MEARLRIVRTGRSWAFAGALIIAAIGGQVCVPAAAAVAADDAAESAAGDAPQDNGYESTIAAANAAMLVDPALALTKAVIAEHYGEDLPNTTKRALAVARARWLQGEAYLRTNDPTKADKPIRSAIAVVAKFAPQSKLHADVLLSLGWVDSNQGRVGNALFDYQKAFEIYRTLRDARSQARTLVFIALLYDQAMDQETALKYYKQAFDVYKSDTNLSVSIYNNRALAFAQLQRYAEAAAALNAALVIARKLDSRNLVEQIYINLARVYLEARKPALADQAIRMGQKVADPNDAGLRARLLATAAQSAFQQGNRQRALTLVSAALVGVDPKTTEISYRDVHQTAYDVFVASHEPERALAQLQALKRLGDNATKLATSTKTALMAARFDFANQELRISQLKADELRRSIAFERSQAQTQRYVFLGAAAAVAIVIALLAFALITSRRSRDRIHAANDDLAVINAALGTALAAKTEFLATTSHEIRTPLNGILGMTQVMLADAHLPPSLRDRLNVVHGAGVTMRALVDDILDVAKMETGNLTIESAPFDLHAVVTDAARLWQEQAQARGLTFDVDLDRCPTMILGDAARLRQIIFNLLSNALKFTKAGRVALRVDVDGEGRLQIAVSDSGIGIPADKMEAIFESFRQADAGTTRQFGGTGLGLAICRNLARAMGGDVSVRSVVGQGATFTLSLPFVPAAAPSVEPDREDEQAATLVVDRNPITRSMFRALLAGHGSRVILAASIDDAIACLATGNVTRVLIDDATVRAAADVHGDLVRIARAAEACGAETTLLWPVSAVREKEELLATGVTRVVARPITGAALIAAVFAEPKSDEPGHRDLVSNAA